MTTNLKELIEPMHGWCTPEKAQVLFDLILKSNSQFTVELGVFGGRSLIPMGLAHKEKQSGVVIGIDAWCASASLEGVNDKANDDWWKDIDYKAIKQSCIDAIDANDLWEFCETLHMRSKTFGALIGKEVIDILHQDSNHSEATTCMEVELFAPLIRAGGYWISDDTDWKTTQKAQALLIAKGFDVYSEFNTYKIFRKK